MVDAEQCTLDDWIFTWCGKWLLKGLIGLVIFVYRNGIYPHGRPYVYRSSNNAIQFGVILCCLQLSMEGSALRNT